MATEADFLAARQARSLARESKNGGDAQRRKEERNAFWDSVKTFFRQWTQRLEALNALNDNEQPNQQQLETPMNEQQKRIIQMKLTQLKDELQLFRKHCLSTSSFEDDLSVRQHQQQLGEKSSEVARDDLTTSTVVTPPPHLPLSEIRILHQEFAKYQQRFEQVKHTLLPKGKFVFSRYRQAMALQTTQQKQGDSTLIREALQTALQSQTYKTQEEQLPTIATTSCLQALSHATIIIHENGSVHVHKSQSESSTSNDDAVTPCVNNTDEPVDHALPITIRDLHHCTITLYCSYATIHLRNVHHSNIIVQQPVKGALHMTSVTQSHLQLQGSCQQIRLHESLDVQCVIFAGGILGGAILEDCRRIVFAVPERYERTVDIRDFSFLKKGVPSPNFRIERLSMVEKSQSDIVVATRTVGSSPFPSRTVNHAQSTDDCKRKQTLDTAVPTNEAPILSPDDDDDSDDDEL